MHHNTKLIIVAVVLFTLVGVTTLMADEEQAPFTAAELNEFLADWPKLQQWAEEREQRLEYPMSPAGLMVAAPTFNAETFLESEGWDPERFFYVAGHAWMATVVLESRREAPELIAEIDAAIAEVRATPGVSEEEKEELIEGFEEMKAVFLGLEEYVEVDPVEIELVAPRESEIREVLGVE